MTSIRGSVALVTGASRGLGVQMAEGLAHRGARLALTARSEQALLEVKRRLEQGGAEVLAIPADVTDSKAQEHLVAETVREFGCIDVLVNNAGIVQPCAYEQLPFEELERQIATNLTAPMALARRVLPLMLAHNRGHIVNVSSLGGLLGIGWGEPYSATKHGLVGFTRSLRAYLKGSGVGVSASVLCPGFIDEVGMYVDTVNEHGQRAPIALGTSAPAAVVRALIRSIEKDLPEIIVSPRPIRLLCAVSALWPRVGGWILRKLGADLFFRATAEARGRLASGD